MKDKIPTIEIIIGSYKAEVYSWLTQEEEDKYNEILGINEFSQEVAGTQTVPTQTIFKISLGKLNEANQYRLKCLVKSPTWEEFNVWDTDSRKQLFDEIDKLVNKKK